MLEQKEINIIKKTVEEFFEKMTITVSNLEIGLSSSGEDRDVVSLNLKSDEPQILIGQGGQTLFETQRLLKTILNKKLQQIFYFNLDINEYKKKKVEYLKDLAKESADKVSLTKEEKIFTPMSSYERRVIHSELSQRTDVLTESQGEGFDRHIVIKPK
jgi:spoIIIJ-associated protein